MELFKTQKINDNVTVDYNNDFVIVSNNKGGPQVVSLKLETFAKIYKLVFCSKKTEQKNEKQKKEKRKAKLKSKPKAKPKR